MNLFAYLKKYCFGIISILLFAILFFLFYQKFYYSFGPDFVSYYSIAKHYASGNFKFAINDWWSPMYSWLMALLIKLNINALDANKIIQLCTALYTYIYCCKIVFFFVPCQKHFLAKIVLLSVIPFLAYWALFSDTPDFLASAFLIHFLYLLLLLKNKNSFILTIGSGIIAAFAFYSKSFNFYFIIVFVFVNFILNFFISKTLFKQKFKQIAWVLPFLVFVFIWLFICYTKTNKFQITSRVEPQLCDIKFKTKPNAIIQPYDCSGLFFDSTSLISNWEQPFLYKQSTKATSLFYSSMNYNNVISNISLYLTKYLSKYQLLFLIILLIIYYKWIMQYWFLCLSYIIIYTSGHFLFHLETRFFIMPSLALMILLIVAALNCLHKFNFKQAPFIIILISAFLICKTPILQLLQYKADLLPYNMKLLANKHNISNAVIAAEPGFFEEALYFSFYTNSKCVGTQLQSTTVANTKIQLLQNKVTHLLQLDSAQNVVIIPFIK